MSVCIGIDVHRKRSQVAVTCEGGEVLVSRDVPYGARPVLLVIAGLPAGTPAAYEAAFGCGWLLGAAGRARFQAVRGPARCSVRRSPRRG